MRRLLLAAAVAAPLVACGERPPLDLSTVPDGLLTCAGAPAWRGRTQRDVAGHLVDWRAAHADCAGKLDEVRSLARPTP